MSASRNHSDLRAEFAPEVILCDKCEGHGTLLIQNDTRDYYDRSTKLCETCQETGLKGIPESEVNEVRFRG
jgi:hypothetical protein